MAFINQADLEARLERSITGDELNAFNVINAALQSHLERQIGSSLESVSATTRYYDGGLQHLAIDPCTTVTSLIRVDDDQVTQDTFDTSDYTLEPINRTCKQMIRYRPGKFPRGINNIGVTAKFSIDGDTDLVNMAKHALIESLVAELGQGDNVKRESIEGYSIEYATSQTKNNLNQFFSHFQVVI